MEKRQRLTAAALALFREKGYERTSIDDIAARADIAVGGFYLHFKSKGQLLLALMDDLLQALSQVDLTIAAGIAPREVVDRLLQQAFARDLRFLGAYRAWQEAVLLDADFAARDEAIHRWTEQRVIALFEQLQRLPGARRGVDAQALGRVMDRFFWALMAEAMRLKGADVDRWVTAASDVTYHALFED